jgi:acetyl esterase/lipase
MRAYEKVGFVRLELSIEDVMVEWGPNDYYDSTYGKKDQDRRIEMKQKIFFPLLLLFVLSIACRGSASATPAPLASATAIESDPSPVSPTQEVVSSFDTPDESSRPPIEQIMANARDAQRDVTYCTVNGVELKMDIYFPKNTTGTTPLVVFVHGGGWRMGDKGRGPGMTEFPALLSAGFTVASLNYRLAPEYKFPAMIEDVKCAIRSFRAHADEYGIDPNRIGVWGESAGAHLANMIGLTDESAGFDVGEYLDQSSRVSVVIEMSGPTDLTVDFSQTFIEAKNNAYPGYDMVKASPITYITSDDPPFLIMQGDADPVVPIGSDQAQKLYAGLVAVGVQTQLVIVTNGNHTLNAPNQSPSREELTTMIVDFFSRYLK